MLTTVDRVLSFLNPVEEVTPFQLLALEALIIQLSAVLECITGCEFKAEYGDDIPPDIERALCWLVVRDFKAITEGRLGIKSEKFRDAETTFDYDHLPPDVEQTIQRHTILGFA
jgi:hypothetical protein